MAEFDWNHLRSFLAVARCGKLTTAATRLCSDHTTLSRRIGSLEHALHARLFDRSPQGYTLTEQGHRLFEVAEDIERLALSAAERVGGGSDKVEGALRIGAPDGFGSYFLAPRISKLAKRYPGLSVQLVTGPSNYSLSKREADIAVTVRQPSEGRLVTCKLTDYRLGLYASAAYLAEAPEIHDKADLRQHRFVGYIGDLLHFSELDYREQIEGGLTTPLESTNLLTQLRATLAGAGICVMPSFIAHSEPALLPVLPDSVWLTRSFWLTMHEDLKNVARVKAGVAFIRQEVKTAESIFLDSPAAKLAGPLAIPPAATTRAAAPGPI